MFQISYQPNWQIDKLWPLLKGQSCGTLKSWYTAWDLAQGFWCCFAHVTYWAMLATIYFGKFLLPPGNLRSQQTQWITGSVFQISYQPNWQIDKLWPLLKGQSCGTLKSWYTAWDLEQGFWRCFLHMLLTGLCLQQSTLVNFYYHLGICKILQSVKTVIRNEECVSCLSVILTRSIVLVMPVFHKEKTAIVESQCNSPRDSQNKLCLL